MISVLMGVGRGGGGGCSTTKVLSKAIQIFELISFATILVKSLFWLLKRMRQNTAAELRCTPSPLVARELSSSIK